MKKLEKFSTKYTEIYVLGNKEYNAYHNYTIRHKDVKPYPCIIDIHFQKGPVKEYGLNGIFIEDLLRICEHRLECFQESDFKCKENLKALTHITLAIDWLDKRIKDRESRNVQGTYNV